MFLRSGLWPQSIVEYLNREQSFRVIPEDWHYVYVSGQFYRPAMRLGPSFDPDSFELRPCFVTDSVIGAIGSEKGRSISDDTWEADSLFGVIDRAGTGTGVEGLFNDPEILVCDDLGSEGADFFMCDTRAPRPRAVLIHAKASSDVHLCSAGALHEVCSQALKNLAYVTAFTSEAPTGVRTRSWDGPWRGGSIGEVSRRIRRGEADALKVWNVIRTTLNNPVADREVWLVLGQILSLENLTTRLAQSNPAAEVLQATYLLHSTMTSVAAVGAKLRIISSP